MKEETERAAEVLRRGGIILYPTDTVWGIGCDATNADAVERIYALKRSANKKGMIVLTDSIEHVGRYFRSVPPVAWELLECADRPLTLILPGACGVAENLVPEEGTLAIRVPDHEFCRGLVRRLGRPLVSTSANLSGEATPVRFGDVVAAIREGVDYTVDVRCEGSPTGKASSIIMLGTGGEVKVIRE
ncbi:MAG TPA: threonylcarbamoyl-AMP synthase [Candidatus Tidjanibacter gallistercoris]|nr:threonylcarbamoyl-AMP synthase [Candidatus Tidjanibacter gallistercoris]